MTTAIFLGLAIGLALLSILQRLTTMTKQLDDLAANVAAIELTADEMIARFDAFKAELDQGLADEDLEALADLSARLGAQQAEMRAALDAARQPVVENPVENPVE